MLSLFMTLALSAAATASPTPVHETPPNIVLILSDDQGWSGLSVPMHPTLKGASSPIVRTPNLEAFAAQALRFSQAYAPAPVCSPTRASLQTGKNPARLHWTKAARVVSEEDGHRLIPPAIVRSLDSSEVTIAEVLSRAGYTTAHYGKWHLGGGGPGRHGYDEHDGDTGNGDAAPFVDPNPVDIFGMVERAEEFMASAKKSHRPFFVQLSFHALHYPQNARPATLDAVAARGGVRNEKELQRAAIAEDLDDGVGRLLRSMDASGLAKSTFVIYMSDNGAGGGGGKGLLSGGKGGVSEGGIRVPFILRGPGVPKGAWCHEPVCGFDLYPTFAEWAGVKSALPADLEGTSLAELASRPKSKLERTVPGLVFHFPHYQDRAGPQSAIRVGDLKLLHYYETDRAALFDVVADLGERRDLSAERPEEEAKLRTLLEQHLEAMGAGMPAPNPLFREGVEPTPRKQRGEKGEKKEKKDGRGAGRGGRGQDAGGEAETRGGLRGEGDGVEAPPEARPFLAFEGVEVRWDEDFLYVGSNGLPDHRMMVGIEAWNQQVPLPQPFHGENVFRIPRRPKRLDEPRETVLEGPIAVAVNGIPIFDPTTQGGRHDAFEHGELDEFGGHAGRADDYHYHVAPMHLLEVVGKGQPIAYGLDGFPIYGDREANGRPVRGLDEAHGHVHDDGTYHYHGSPEKPYFMGAFAGEVDLEARPRMAGVRPFTRPLRGARITGFEGSVEAGFELRYTLRGDEHQIHYRIRDDGGVDFRFLGPDGTVVEESHDAPRERRRGGGRGRGGARGEQDKEGRGADGRREGREGRGRGRAGGAGADGEEARRPWILEHVEELDADGDGALHLEELRAEVLRAHAAYDADSDGEVDGNELDGGVRVRSAVAGFLRGHRDELDADGDGSISRDEALATFERFHVRQDANGDGVLKPDETGENRPPQGRRGGGQESRRPREARAGEQEIPGRRRDRSSEGDKRNIVLIFIDDMGWNDVGFMGNEFVETPRLDSLAREGVIFDAAYASAPNCAPTRACLLSGQWPGRHGVYTVVDERNAPGQPWHRLLAAPSEPSLARETVTFAEALAGRGYATGFFGMWNLGRRETGAEGQGFATAVRPSNLGFGKNAYQSNDGRQLPDALTDEALGFIERNQDDSFLCYLALHSVHAPFDPDPSLLAKYERRARRGDDPAFAATVEAVDRNVGRLVDRLRALGLDDSTVVLFTSDNGGERGRTAPLRGGKGQVYEGGLRVPFFAWGAGVEGGRRLETPISSIDVYPTLLELSGSKVGKDLDGTSLVSLLAGESSLDRGALYWHFPCYTGQGTPASAMLQGRLKIVQHFEAGRVELYDLDEDPYEAHDLASERPQEAAALLVRLERWRADTGAIVPEGENPDFDPQARRGRGGAEKGRGAGRGPGRERGERRREGNGGGFGADGQDR